MTPPSSLAWLGLQCRAIARQRVGAGTHLPLPEHYQVRPDAIVLLLAVVLQPRRALRGVGLPDVAQQRRRRELRFPVGIVVVRQQIAEVLRGD